MNYYKYNQFSAKSPTGFLSRTWATALLLFGLLCGFNSQVWASHGVGADISYRCLGNNQYEITASYYRDCSGISAPTSVFIGANSVICGVNVPQVQANQIVGSGEEVSPVCPNLIPQTTCNGGTQPGIEVYIYRTTITLPQACRDWTVSFSDCCRNAGVTNLTNAGAGTYVEARINNTNGLCNNSPIFTSRPIPYICANQPFSFNNGTVDADGDSLFYSIIEPRDAGNTILTYAAPFSTTYPMGTVPANQFNFNPRTGQMNFTPAPNQLAVVAMRVVEIRNGDTIGIVMRDIQIRVVNNCTNGVIVPNNAPVISAGGTFDTTARAFIVCSGNQLIFRVSARDPNPGDTLGLDIVNTNLLQVFGAGNFQLVPDYPNAQPGCVGAACRYDTIDVYVIIQANTANLGVNQFTIGLTDNACPVPSAPVLGFQVVIPGVEIQARDTVLCPGIAQNIVLPARTFSSVNSAVAGTFLWQRIAGVAATLSNNTISSPSVSIPATTINGDSVTFRVTYTTIPDPQGNTCTTADSVTVYFRALPLSVIASTTDTALCQNGIPNLVNFNTRISGPGIDTVNGNYVWTAIPASRLANLSATNIPNPSGSISGIPNDTARYIVQYSYGGCIGRDTALVFFNAGRAVVTPTTISACAGDTVQLNASLSIASAPVACTDYQVTQITHAPIAGTGTTITLSDDQLSAPQPIGFPFVFMCDTVTQFIISSNGFITFDLTNFGSGCCSGPVLPNNLNDPDALIALAWNDLYPPGGGGINYFVTGTAPNRRLVVNYTALRHCCTSAPPTVTGQIIIYEGSNAIELHSTSITNDGSTMTQGISNRGNTIAYTVPGRNGVDWSASNSAYRFTLLPPPTTYSWRPNVGLLPSDTIANPRAIVTGNTTYVVSVTELGCPMWDSIRVTLTTALPAPTVTCSSVGVNSAATEIGFAWSPIAGAASWEYSLDSGRTWISQIVSDTDIVLTNRLNGSCIAFYVRAVGGSSACLRNASGSFVCCTSPCTSTATATQLAISCAGNTDGALQVTSTGGTLGAPYSVSLFNAANNAQIGTTVSSNGSAQVGTLPVGVYYVRSTDAFGCPGRSANVTVTEPSPIVASFVSLTNALCFNTATGTATVSGSGGTAPYVFSWSANTQNTATNTGLAAGSYNATVTDASGCVDTVANIIIRNSFAQAPAATLGVTNSTSCPNGNGVLVVQSVLNMTGNPSSFQYSWSNGSTASSATGLNAGNYTVTITDNNGCTLTQTASITGVTVFISGFSLTQPSCGVSNGTISVNASNGTAPYSYVWGSNANGQITQTINGLASGAYSVTVTDANGCQVNGSAFLNSNSVQLSILDREERLACFGDMTGFIDIDAVTPVPTTVTYLWSNGATSQDINGLPAGTYTLTASVQSGTSTCASVIGMTVNQPDVPLNINANIIRLLDCSGQPIGQLAAQAQSGWGAYTYAWSNGSTGNDLNNLAAGVYAVTVTDLEGCTDTASLILIQPQTVIVNGYINSVGQNSYSVLENVTNIALGVAPVQAGVTYSWTPTTSVSNPSAATTTVDAPPAGVYIYTVTANSVDCSDTDTVRLEVIASSIKGIPSAFTPNGDGNNDTFRPVQANNITVSVFQIYNRWGQLVYDNTNNYQIGWDGMFNGQLQPRDTYIFLFEYQVPTQPSVRMRGEVTLLR
jgi:large repetitive protein